jgi:hypothetical protein
VRTVAAGCLRADGTVSLNAEGMDSRRALFPDLIQYEYTALPMLAAALTTPAPMTVPATPKKEASTAAVIDASALATTWMGLRWMARSRSFMVKRVPP